MIEGLFAVNALHLYLSCNCQGGLGGFSYSRHYSPPDPPQDKGKTIEQDMTHYEKLVQL
jgi:hypothetical protein